MSAKRSKHAPATRPSGSDPRSPANLSAERKRGIERVHRPKTAVIQPPIDIKVAADDGSVPVAGPVFSSLRARLDAGRETAQEAAARVHRSTLKSVADALASLMTDFERQAANVRSDDDALRLRSRLAEALRSAADAVSPRTA